MQVEVTVLTRRGAAVMRRPHEVTGPSIRFGRGTDNEVPLADLRVELAAAALDERREGLFIEKVGDAPLRINGRTTAGARIGPGDKVAIGPYEVVFGEPPQGCDAAFTVELVQPMGDALQRLTQTSRIGLERTHLSKRRSSWVLFAVLAVLCLAVPIGAYFGGERVMSATTVPQSGPLALFAAFWNPGELSNQHRFFAKNCGTCHEGAFTRVADKACLTCHAGIGAHIAMAADVGPVKAELHNTRCAACHEEHRGIDSLVINQDSLCTNCHKSLAEAAPKAGILDVRGFPKGHPEFRATVVADAAGPRLIKVKIGPKPQPVDHPNLNFSHAIHLVPKGYPALGYKPMVCADCHRPEPGGQGFLPITYKGQCQRCHQLRFDVQLPWAEVPHGDDAGVETAVKGFYALIAFKGGIPPQPPGQIQRRLPGAPPPPSAALPPDVRAWVEAKTDEAMRIIFDPKRGCFYCHTPDPSRGEYRVAPVLMLTRFLSPAVFDHAKHAPVACAACHDASQSQSSADLLVPGIANCLSCHGSGTAAFKVTSTCTSCHVFHRKEFGPMRLIEAEAK
jgi:predicted CXXCH cytochrome family protein